MTVNQLISAVAFMPLDTVADREQQRTLVARAAGGDRDAFAQLVEMHEPAVTRLVQRLLGWPADVEDVVQEVFVSALLNLHRFRGDSKFATWITTIAINKCRSHGRRRLFRLDVLRRLWSGSESKPEAPVWKRGVDGEVSDQVRAAVQALPLRYREVIVLRYLEERSPAEVASLLKLSKGAVDVRLTRARQMLKESLHHVRPES